MISLMRRNVAAMVFPQTGKQASHSEFHAAARQCSVSSEENNPRRGAFCLAPLRLCISFAFLAFSASSNGVSPRAAGAFLYPTVEKRPTAPWLLPPAGWWQVGVAGHPFGDISVLPAAHADPLPPPVHALELSPRRDYGIVMGDILSSEIRVKLESGYALETASLPQSGSAVNDMLEWRGLHWEKQIQGNETVYQIVAVYQVFKGVRQAETLKVPPLPLRFNHEGQSLEVQAPAWNFTLTPLIPPQTPDEEVTLRGDLPPPLPSNNPALCGLLACLAGLLGLGAYAGWHIGLLRRQVPPFVRSRRALRKLRKQPPSLDTWREGARLVHAALNETAGHTVLSSQLSGFLAAQPRYAGLQAELERFFLFSDRLFFADAADYPNDYPVSHLENLCKRLAAAGAGR